MALMLGYGYSMDKIIEDIKKVGKTKTVIMLNEIRDRLKKIAPNAYMTTLIIDNTFCIKISGISGKKYPIRAMLDNDYDMLGVMYETTRSITYAVATRDMINKEFEEV